MNFNLFVHSFGLERKGKGIEKEQSVVCSMTWKGDSVSPEYLPSLLRLLYLLPSEMNPLN